MEEAIRDRFFTGETPRERYLEGLAHAGLSESLLGRAWIASGEAALASALEVALPHREVGVLLPEEPVALSFRVELRRGERLRVLLRKGDTDEPGWADPGAVFMEIHRLRASDADPVTGDPRSLRVAWNDPLPAQVDSLGYNAAVSGSYLVTLQPELLSGGPYEVELRAGASLAFPVEGHGTEHIQSFFGADRDGGRRVHHGVDVFAPRGTPVLAAGPGVVRRVNETPVGGKVVWVFDEERNLSRYYAHLDSQTVTAGERVLPGDTLGLVGNTGNARTTPPHLHFGIYVRGSGPVDPYPYLFTSTRNPPPIRAAREAVGARGGWNGSQVRVVGIAADRYRIRVMENGRLRERWVPADDLHPLQPQQSTIGVRGME